MGIIIYGVLKTPINVDDFLVKCPSCETDSWAETIVISEYYHIYYIPIFPTGKEANTTCNKCGLKSYGRNFNQNLISNYNEIKGQFKHPWFTYIGLSVMILIVFGIIISAIL